MTRLATLLCLLAAASVAEAGEVGGVLHRPPADTSTASSWTLHPVLSLPTPLLAVSHRDTTDGGTTTEFFGRLTDIGFACLALAPPRRRIRRTEVVCARDAVWFSYAGGWPKDGGIFVVDRIQVGGEGSAELLGGAQVGGHIRAVLGRAEPEQATTMRETAVR